MELPTLESRRLDLRGIMKADIDFIYELNSDPEVVKYVFKKEHTYEEAEADLERYLSFPEKYQLPIGVWVAFELETAQPVGIFFIKKLEETGEIEIGYRLAKEHWNKGYATEGSKELLEYALNDLGITRIVAVTNPENIASSHVLQKLGLLYEKTDAFYNETCKYYGLTIGAAYFL
ncbi:MAG: GNAT family N-acetyltransferase [Saprospiraceae bacterium]